ncbi:MAG: hypothetical protein R2854_04760 [Caldilineaceae bacterium]
MSEQAGSQFSDVQAGFPPHGLYAWLWRGKDAHVPQSLLIIVILTAITGFTDARGFVHIAAMGWSTFVQAPAAKAVGYFAVGIPAYMATASAFCAVTVWLWPSCRSCSGSSSPSSAWRS